MRKRRHWNHRIVVDIIKLNKLRIKELFKEERKKYLIWIKGREKEVVCKGREQRRSKWEQIDWYYWVRDLQRVVLLNFKIIFCLMKRKTRRKRNNKIKICVYLWRVISWRKVRKLLLLLKIWISKRIGENIWRVVDRLNQSNIYRMKSLIQIVMLTLIWYINIIKKIESFI